MPSFSSDAVFGALISMLRGLSASGSSNGSFSRSLRLPLKVKDEKVEAKYVKGVLTVRVPKPAEAQRAVRRIEVKAA